MRSPAQTRLVEGARLELIDARRRELGLGRERCCAGAGVSIGTLKNIEAGRMPPQLGTLVGLCRVLEIRADEILEPDAVAELRAFIGVPS